MKISRAFRVVVFIFSLFSLIACQDKKSPTDSFEEIKVVISNGDWLGLYDCLSAKTQGRYDVSLGMMAAFSEDIDESLSGNKLLAAYLLSNDDARDTIEDIGKAKVVKETISDNVATITMEGDVTMTMVRENDEWKLIIE